MKVKNKNKRKRIRKGKIEKEKKEKWNKNKNKWNFINKSDLQWSKCKHKIDIFAQRYSNISFPVRSLINWKRQYYTYITRDCYIKF